MLHCSNYLWSSSYTSGLLGFKGLQFSSSMIFGLATIKETTVSAKHLCCLLKVHSVWLHMKLSLTEMNISVFEQELSMQKDQFHSQYH